jgi:hypothetical protein
MTVCAASRAAAAFDSALFLLRIIVSRAVFAAFAVALSDTTGFPEDRTRRERLAPGSPQLRS